MASFVPEYSTFEGWEDTIRTPQDDGSNPVVAIKYPDDCMYFYYYITL